MTRLTPVDGIAVVTGAGSGLGRALALELAGQGLTVVGFGRRLAALEETQVKAGGRFHSRALDVSAPDAVAQSFAAIEAELGPVALLINCAAVYPHRDFLDETPQSFMASVGVNLGGMVNCTHAALQGMVARGRGRIVNVATFADIAPLPTASAYAVSKGAARVFTRALVADLGDRFPGIVIGDWMPGMLRTEMGIPDGIDPKIAAHWGAELALRLDPDLNGAVFEQAIELLPPRGIKARVRDRLLMRKVAQPRRLD
ncbi:SDR family oxidoreductase [Puniceibacterium sp. IMCC21224]|uniref:SDR family oxidoreductase n=1 Tax=Puniceibacterium sp. IMCC21224 TaxID=1618204 RepID=UPI00064DFA29|nr:SDR family oxidoreductase [Puniceibacterium sp. IMCC21224]KMK65653.1 short-chain dehydrogenase of unknown substrate specificity [Puniceibacterium sp. IMCC21224]